MADLKSTFCVACGLSALVFGSTALKAQALQATWKLESGYYFSQGDYGLDKDTRIAGVPFSLRYRGWPWRVKLSSMWVSLDGPGTLTDGDVASGRTAVSRNENGMADTSLFLDREGLSFQRRLYWSAGVRIKVPTGSEKDGLGTGELDYEPRFTLMYLTSSVKPYLMGRYTIKGDSASRDYENIFGWTLGVSCKLSPTVNTNVQAMTRESALRHGEDRLELMANASWNVSPQWETGVYLIKGLKDGSPDWGGGLTVAYQWKSGRLSDIRW